eukprot:TRINITY_DN12831_c0_g1_i2.p1 TRINITY_DN12831_c0_g1~~TRINITY_DN12831_c0_g1_i2.p1  ORF type:complete len:187 (-),score=50.71 TRINITY_DN12831_c0_g1_i2:273-833(-)
MIRRPPRSTLSSSSAASDVYKRQIMMTCILLCWLGFGRSTEQFGRWDLRVWLVFVVYGFGQQMLVTWSSQDDLKGQEGEQDIGFGWAPLAPIPTHVTLFQLHETKFSFQVMQPWILAPNLLFALFVLIHKRYSPEGCVGSQPQQGEEEEGASEPLNSVQIEDTDTLKRVFEQLDEAGDSSNVCDQP